MGAAVANVGCSTEQGGAAHCDQGRKQWPTAPGAAILVGWGSGHVDMAPRLVLIQHVVKLSCRRQGMSNKLLSVRPGVGRISDAAANSGSKLQGQVWYAPLWQRMQQLSDHHTECDHTRCRTVHVIVGVGLCGGIPSCAQIQSSALVRLSFGNQHLSRHRPLLLPPQEPEAAGSAVIEEHIPGPADQRPAVLGC